MAMKKDRVIEREDQGCLERLLKDGFNMQLHELRSLKTATKKRRALRRAAENFVLTSRARPLPVNGAPFNESENARKGASASGH
jgi:hypothetical protein